MVVLVVVVVVVVVGWQIRPDEPQPDPDPDIQLPLTNMVYALQPVTVTPPTPVRHVTKLMHCSVYPKQSKIPDLSIPYVTVCVEVPPAPEPVTTEG